MVTPSNPSARPGVMFAATKMDSQRVKVRFLAVAEKAVMRVLFCQQKVLVPDLNSETANRSCFVALVFYVHGWVQGMRVKPPFFC